MASFKSYPIFYSVIVVLGLVVVAEGWGIYDRSATASKSAKVLTQKQGELNSLRTTNPVPTTENKAAVEADLARTEIALGKMREELKGHGETVTKLRSAVVPADPTGMFFDITGFVEKNRDRAEATGIKIKADERFGFSTYANAGPDRDLISQVFRQRQIAEYLVNTLFEGVEEAKPVEFVSLQRERPKTQAELAAQVSPEAGAVAPAANATTNSNPDLFEIDRRITARVPSFVDATAFRLTFVGGTPALRSVLNKLATFELPLVVRSVEVEPITAAQKQAAAAPAPAATLASIFGTPATAVADTPPPAKPLVEKVLSKFTVTVELIDLVEAPKTP